MTSQYHTIIKEPPTFPDPELFIGLVTYQSGGCHFPPPWETISTLSTLPARLPLFDLIVIIIVII